MIIKKNRFILTTTVGSKGQIVIPKEIRDLFDIKPGDNLLILGDKKKGIAILKSDTLADKIIIKEKKWTH